MKKKTLYFVGVAALSMAALIPIDALADSHTLSLSVGSCVSLAGAVEYDWEGISNPSTTGSTVVDCGVPFTVRDGSLLKIEQITVIDNSTTDAVTCFAEAYDVNSNVPFFTSAGKTSSIGGVGQTVFPFFILPMPKDGVSMRAVCVLPPRQGTVGSQISGLVAAGAP